MQTLPPPIRKYLAEEKHTAVARALIAKYNLRVDQAGILEREIALLLLGIDDPTEFNKALLEEARLDPGIVGNIMQDVNTQIFVPLREQMRNAAPNAQPLQQPVKPAAPQPAPRGPGMPAPKYYAPPPQSPTYFNLDNKLPAPSQPFPFRPAAAAVAPLPPKNILPRSAPPVTPKPVSQMLPDHEEPHLELKDNTAPPAPSAPVPPSSKPELREALRTVLPPPRGNAAGQPPPNLPGAPSSDIMPPPPKSPPAAPYSVDPYREPIE